MMVVNSTHAPTMIAASAQVKPAYGNVERSSSPNEGADPVDSGSSWDPFRRLGVEGASEGTKTSRSVRGTFGNSIPDERAGPARTRGNQAPVVDRSVSSDGRAGPRHSVSDRSVLLFFTRSSTLWVRTRTSSSTGATDARTHSRIADSAGRRSVSGANCVADGDDPGSDGDISSGSPERRTPRTIKQTCRIQYDMGRGNHCGKGQRRRGGVMRPVCPPDRPSASTRGHGARARPTPPPPGR